MGTAERRDQALYGYTPNGQLASLTDGNGNRSEMRYDGHDRLTRLVYPHPTLAGLVNEADYEGYTLDAAGNVTSRRLRDGQSIGQGYDALNRLTSRDLPATAWFNLDRSYIYDNLGRMIEASGNGTITRSYDALGRITAETTPWGTTSYRYDAAGRRSGMDHPAGGPTIGYSYTDTGEMTAIREDPAGANVLLATYDYDALGRRITLTRGNGTSTSYSYDPVSRLATLNHDLLSAGSDFSASLTRNAAGQIIARTASDGGYAFAAIAQSRTDTHNGRNQIVAAGAIAIGHDANGNVSLIGATGYSYTANNRLATVWDGSVYREMIDDSMDRLHRYYDGSANRWLLYDDHNLIAESNPNAGTIARRYVHGPGTDEPLVWYEGGTRRWLHADERGSIVAVSDSSGQALAYHAYDEYGRPQGPAGLDSLYGRFGYTGQPWFGELGLYYYRRRMYDPVVTVRFMQADPAGYEAGSNLYWYGGGDPINMADPTGQFTVTAGSAAQARRIEQLINQHAAGTYRFNAQNELGRVGPSEQSGPTSELYARDIDAMIASPQNVMVGISPTVIENGTAVDVDAVYSGGITYTATQPGQDVQIILSGNGANVVPAIDGTTLSQTPSEILMHEFSVHSRPYMSDGMDGTTEHENRIRKELGLVFRGSTPGHH